MVASFPHLAMLALMHLALSAIFGHFHNFAITFPCPQGHLPVPGKPAPIRGISVEGIWQVTPRVWFSWHDTAVATFASWADLPGLTFPSPDNLLLFLLLQ